MPNEKTDEESHRLPQFEYVPPPLKLTLLKPIPQQNGSVRYLEATEDDLAEVLLSLGDEGRQRVGHLIQKKLQEEKKGGQGSEPSSS